MSYGPFHRPIDKPPGGSQSYLATGLRICKEIMSVNDKEWKPVRCLHDQHGVYAYTADAGDFKLLLIARKYIMGKWVGAGVDVVERCIDEDRHLLIYILDSNKIYRFDAEECKLYGRESTRGARKYLDFEIKLGMNLIAFLEESKNLEEKQIREEKEGLQNFME